VTTYTPGASDAWIPTTVSTIHTASAASTVFVTATSSPAKSASPAGAAPALLLILTFLLLISALLAPAAALATLTAADEEAPTAIKPRQQNSPTVPTTPCDMGTASSAFTVDGGYTVTPGARSPPSSKPSSSPPASAVKKALVTPSTIGPSGNGGLTTISGTAYMTVAAYGGAKARSPPLVVTYLAVTIPLVLTGCLMGVEPSWLGLGMEVGGAAMLTAIGLRLGVLA